MSAETVGALHFSSQGLPENEEVVAVSGVCHGQGLIYL